MPNSSSPGDMMKITATLVLIAMILADPAIALQLVLQGSDRAAGEHDVGVPREPLAAAGLESDAPLDDKILKAGTEIKLVFAQALSSKHATIGEKVELRVAVDVAVDQIVVVPAGARVLGTVVQGKKNEKYGNSKDLAVSVDYIVTRGKRIKLTGEKKQKAKTDVGAATAATIGLGLSGLMIYMSQREAWIREGTQATGYVAEDVSFLRPEIESKTQPS